MERVRSARVEARLLGRLNQGTQGSVDGLLVGKMRGDIRRKQDQIRSCAVAREIFAADPALQPGQVVFRPQPVIPLPLARFSLHNVFVRAA